MNRRPRLPFILRGWWRAGSILVAAAAACLSAGCALNADFDRPRPELVRDNTHDWVGRKAAASVGQPVSEFSTTDQERELRDRAYALIEPPYNRNRWDSIWREYGYGRNLSAGQAEFDRSAYFGRLDSTHRRSEASAYAQIVTDARNDVERLDPFFTIAGRVVDMDRRRAQSLAHVSALSDRESANAIARNNENIAIVAWVCRALKERVSSYRFALERLVVAAPSSNAVDTDRAITLIATRTAQYCGARAGLAARG